jgi:hypothetical protein
VCDTACAIAQKILSTILAERRRRNLRMTDLLAAKERRERKEIEKGSRSVLPFFFEFFVFF